MATNNNPDALTKYASRRLTVLRAMLPFERLGPVGCGTRGVRSVICLRRQSRHAWGYLLEILGGPPRNVSEAGDAQQARSGTWHDLTDLVPGIHIYIYTGT
jgi:hypothetical protein